MNKAPPFQNQGRGFVHLYELFPMRSGIALQSILQGIRFIGHIERIIEIIKGLSLIHI